MNFPETSTSEVFKNIPVGSVEAMPDFMWSDALWHLGNCKIDLKQKIGKGFIDVKLRYYNDLGDKYVWLLGEYKKEDCQELQAIAQLLMYLGNFFYDTNIEGIDNLAGIFVASGDHFRLIRRENLLGIMEKFEYIWRKHFRVSPCSAYEEPEIKRFIKDNSDELLAGSLLAERYGKNLRLDEIIKSIYEAWNLQ